ncbi:unnamed protein product [Staurois parvus]|uniref:Uncharacterized protein n=1 Tax=Staurois parvus TaxID=386267 RepID=A0ABN9EJR5_9NEOB|nr:unnamed protein product [Staurois parvus]
MGCMCLCVLAWGGGGCLQQPSLPMGLSLVTKCRLPRPVSLVTKCRLPHPVSLCREGGLFP